MKALKQHTSLHGVLIILLLTFFTGPDLNGQELVKNEFQFNGYTNYWHDTYNEWYRYGNLFKLARPQVEKTILQSKVDIAEDMGIPGLLMEEGFLYGLLSGSYKTLEEPDANQLGSALSDGDVLAFVDPGSETGKQLLRELPADWEWPHMLNSHQYGANSLVRADLFRVAHGEHTLYVVSSSDGDTRRSVGALIDQTAKVLGGYDLHKGWFGAYTLLNSVTCTKGHPLEVIGTGMNEGCDWFVFDGYMDFLSKNELADWMDELDLPVVTDVGFFPVYACPDYDGLQVQSLFTKESWNEYAHQKGGYVFRRVWDQEADPLAYDGYLAVEGNKEQIDQEDVPFILKTGQLDQNALNSMVLFIEKDQELSWESMWEAIMDRREVGVMQHGKMLGPALYRNALQMLLLDREYLEDYFNDRVDLRAEVNGYDLKVTVRNFGSEALYGDVELSLPDGVSTADPLVVPLDIPVNSAREVNFTLQPGKGGMDHTNPLGVEFKMEDRKKSTLAMLDMPPAISVHRLLYGHAPKVNYPVSVHNFSKETSFPVEVQVFPRGKRKPAFSATRQYSAATGSHEALMFELELPAGEYEVKVTALGMDYTSQLGVGKAEGKPYVYEVDLNSDGIKEYRMENDSVQVTLLTTGGRVIEYIVKSRDDNVFFKLWPEKAVDHKRAFRRRGYYPYGGFEDFLGQASMETHQVYNAEIVETTDDFVRVRMWTDYFGNRLEKTYTLYGNSPLLEARFALTFINEEANVIGPQCILELGEKHWTEDVFIVPEKDGHKEYRMKPERTYGRVQYLQEGWNAGYDTEADITYLGAFPVDQPLFLHMWMNHPRNNDAHHYYMEFQPWTTIDQMNTTYFTYYMWGAGGPWENGVQELRERNLISVTQKE
ncbi:MAG: hypothetical protein ABFS28_14230 [Bacteroidota bacterium]